MSYGLWVMRQGDNDMHSCNHLSLRAMRSNLQFIITIMLLSLAFFSTACLAAGKPPDMEQGVYGHIMDENGSLISRAEVSMFDGFTIRNTRSDSNGKYIITDLPVSKNNYLVIFVTKEGLIPRADNILVDDMKIIEHSPVMKRVTKQDIGFIIGTVYKPIRGGKFRFNNGINSFVKKMEVLLKGNSKVITKETGPDGQFIFEVPAGKYTLGIGGSREKVEIDLSAGETVIKNLRSGFILVD